MITAKRSAKRLSSQLITFVREPKLIYDECFRDDRTPPLVMWSILSHQSINVTFKV